MNTFAYSVVDLLLAYLLGSIPFGYLVAKSKGIDITKVGSGNIGATNVFRSVGKVLGVIVFLCDALKGWVAVTLLAAWTAKATGASLLTWQLVNAIVVVLGHTYTCWLKFKGGKGVATSAGILLGLMPLAFFICLATWIVLTFTTRYVSVGSLAAAFALPVSVWFTVSPEDGRVPKLIFGTLISAFVIYKHKSNVQRLLNGTENRFGRKKTAEVQSTQS